MNSNLNTNSLDHRHDDKSYGEENRDDRSHDDCRDPDSHDFHTHLDDCIHHYDEGNHERI